MTKLIHTSLAQNVEAKDLRRAIRLLLNPRTWRENAIRHQLEEALKHRLGCLQVTALDSGRHALRLALEILGVGQGDDVLLQAYTCVSVPGPVLWVGARPLYLDILPTNFTMDPDDLERKITPRSRALIIQHTFGLPADLESLLAIARRHGLAVIEDCAHALGATYRGKLVGTFGDAAIFSFGRDKVISSTFGGALAVNRVDLVPRLGQRASALRAPSAAWTLQQMLHPLLASGARATYFAGGRFALPALQRAHLLSLALTPAEKRGGQPPWIPHLLPGALAALALTQLDRLDAFLHHRQALGKHYTESLLGHARIILPFVPPDRTHGFLRYAIRVPDPKKLHTAARRLGIILGDWYDAVVAPRDTDLAAVQYVRGTCPRAEEAARTSVNLPTSPVTTVPDADRVLRCVQRELF